MVGMRKAYKILMGKNLRKHKRCKQRRINSKVTRCDLDSPSLTLNKEVGRFPFTTTFRLALTPTDPPTEQPDYSSGYSPSPDVYVKNAYSYTLMPPICLHV
jgi:hypothetical protein